MCVHGSPRCVPPGVSLLPGATGAGSALGLCRGHCGADAFRLARPGSEGCSEALEVTAVCGTRVLGGRERRGEGDLGLCTLTGQKPKTYDIRRNKFAVA